jgi:D-aminoacyl-tRNA deacylase
MKALIQKVQKASVIVDNRIIGSINQGYVIFLGVRYDDQFKDAEFVAKKTTNLRIFEDDRGKMNLSIQDIEGEVLVISQFTLYADTRKGNRPGFTDAANPELADELYNHFVKEMQNHLGTDKVSTGKFRSHMDVELVNDGPVTIELSSDHKKS